MNKTNNKILYSLYLTLLMAAIPSCAYAADTVNAIEILSPDELKAMQKEDPNGGFSHSNNGLGSDYYNVNVQYDKPEYSVKNLKDYLDEKKKKNAKTEPLPAVEQSPDIVINCAEMEYFEDRNELEARDKVEIITPNGVKAYADRAVYNKENNTIKLINNVSLKSGGASIEGDYMLIDLNEENALMEEPTTKVGTITINAEEGYAYSDKIETLNGNIEFNKRVEMEFYSRGFTKYGRAINDTRLVDFSIKKQRSKPYSFKTKQIIIRPEKDHDSMVMKDVDVYYKNKRILKVPSIEMFADKEMTYSELDFPLEFSSLKGFGLYLGLGHTFKLPKNYTLRLTPAFVYGEDHFGAGAIAQLKSKKVNLETGWNSATSNLIFDGNLQLNDRFHIDLGRHVYKSEWFNGGTRAGYVADLIYEDNFLVKDLGNSIFRHRASMGYVADYKRHHQERNMKDGLRYRYMAELSRDIRRFGSTEQDMFVELSAFGQTMATLYSETGDTVALFRVGPRIVSRVKRWNSVIEATLGGIHGISPYQFDEYRYGRQTVSFDESVILNRFLSVGYRGTLSPLKDNRQNEILTENRFYAVVGPEDFKIAFSYDSIRQNMNFDFLFLLGSDNLDMKYQKLTIKDPDKIGKPQRKLSDRELYRVKVPEDL